MKRIMALLTLLLILAGCGYSANSSSGSSASPSATPTASCDASLWQHVYHPDRLVVKQQCMTVTGLVEAVRREPDGDVHIDLRVNDPSLINASNIRYQHGDLVLEEICQGTVTQTDAVTACQGVPHNETIPVTGEKVTVTGSYVLDQNHGWMEIHPVTNLTVGP